MNKILTITLMLFLVPGYVSGHEKIYKGNYIWGAEVHTFKPCNKKNDYWVSFDWAGFKMHEFYKKTFKKPYQPMYIEFRGLILNETLDGFAEEYDGLIRISQVLKYTFEIPAACK